MTISVILPVLNEEALLPQTLAHTLQLGFDEIVLVDGGSSDATPAILQQAVHSAEAAGCVVALTAPGGRAGQMNAGAAISRGEILLFLHADTRLPPNAVTAITSALRDPRYVGGRFDVRFDRDAGWPWVISRLMNSRSRYSGISTGDQAIFVRRQIFQSLGGFPRVPLMEDIEFTRRLKRAGRIAALRTHVVTSYRRWDRQGAVHTIVLMWVLRALYWLGVSPHRLKQLYSEVR